MSFGRGALRRVVETLKNRRAQPVQTAAPEVQNASPPDTAPVKKLGSVMAAAMNTARRSVAAQTGEAPATAPTPGRRGMLGRAFRTMSMAKKMGINT